MQALCIVLVTAAGPPGAGDAAIPEARPADRGEALFDGAEPLLGRIRGHAGTMPPEVLRCGNCHAERGSAGPALRLPPLDRAYLLERRVRRNGPASAYSQAAFCRLVRTRVDPAFVLVDRTMPLFVLSDAQCEGLWDYLTDEARDSD